MAEKAPRQPQHIPDGLIQQLRTVGEKGSHIVAEQPLHPLGGVGGQFQQPALQQGNTGLGCVLQIRQNPCRHPQLPEQKGAQEHHQQRQKAERHTDADPGADHPGDAPVMEEGNHRLRRQRQQQPQQKGKKQRQKQPRRQPHSEQHRQNGYGGFDSETQRNSSFL